MKATRGQVGVIVAVSTVLTLCAALEIRSRSHHDGAQPQATATSTETAEGTAPETASPRPFGGPVESRRTTAPVAPGMAVIGLAFGSQDSGYALLARCGPGEYGKRRCDSMLMATLDGGLSWIERSLPEHGDAELILAVADDRTIGLGAADDAWYVSLDQGRSFQRRPYSPIPYELRPGEFGLLCPDPLARGGCEGPLVEYRRDGPHRFNAEPPLPRLSTDVALAGTTLWAVTADAGKAYAAQSLDRGTTWQRRDPPAAAGVVSDARLTSSPDGKEAWLSAVLDGTATALWQFDPAGAAWRLVPPTGPRPKVNDVAALGGGVLAAVAPEGFGFLLTGGTRWVRPRQSVFNRVASLRLLRDGTLMARGGSGDTWLGVGSGIDRHWVDVTLLAPQG